MRTLEEARAIAVANEVVIPDDVEIRVSRAGHFEPGTYARYLTQLNAKPDDVVTWGQFYREWRNGEGDEQESIFVLVSPEILSSDETIVAVFAHEMYELRELRKLFDEAGGTMKANDLARAIKPGHAKKLHDRAWTEAAKKRRECATVPLQQWHPRSASDDCG